MKPLKTLPKNSIYFINDNKWLLKTQSKLIQTADDYCRHKTTPPYYLYSKNTLFEYNDTSFNFTLLKFSRMCIVIIINKNTYLNYRNHKLNLITNAEGLINGFESFFGEKLCPIT